MKHVGKMKNNGARLAIVYRTLPSDPFNALVVGTNGLGESYHDSLMSLIEDTAGQSANELADILAVRRFPDGRNMLEFLHVNGHLKKIPTSNILMTPAAQTQIPLNELNQLIADQKGVSVEDLAIVDTNAKATPKATKKVADTEPVVEEMRSRADTLYKEAAKLRKDADAIDPPKKKAKTETVEA